MKKEYYIGVDVGGTFTKVALVDHKGRVLSKAQVSSSGFSHRRYFADTLRNISLRLAALGRVSFGEISAMGIGLPGPVDTDRGIILSLTNIKGWNHFHLAGFLEKHLPFPVYVDNDANCMALAESRLGAARGARFALCLTLGTGVGGALILDNNIYRGPFFLGGEVGHMPLSASGPVCTCGGIGCLERYVGNQAIAAQARRVFGKAVALEEVSRLARRGHAKAKKVWRDTAASLALSIAGIVNVLGPQVIVIGGGVAQAGAVLLDPLRIRVRQHAMRHLKNKIKIVRAALGNDAGFLGAALLAKEKIATR
jgi:glucokinase